MLPIILALSVAHVLSMLGAFTFPTLIPQFQALWGLTNTEAGWISGIYLAAYAAAAPVLIALTDRMDARRIYLFGAALTTASLLLFALYADGFWSALFLRVMSGIGLAGTYMPGLRMLIDRIDASQRARAVPLYTAGFSLGSALSYGFSGAVADAFGWQWAFAGAGLAAVVACLIAFAQRPAVHESHAARHGWLLDFRPVLRNRPAMGYVLGYAAHTWELFAFRSWVVAFLVAAAAAQGAAPQGWMEPATVATLGALIAVAASIGGAEIATSRGRAGTVAVYMLLSTLIAAGIGFGFGLPYWLLAVLALIYAGVIQLDSAALTTGAIETADPARRGATLAVHSLLGFLGGFVGALVIGVVLDATGGEGARAWGLAFLSVAVVGLLGMAALLAGTWRHRSA